MNASSYAVMLIIGFMSVAMSGGALYFSYQQKKYGDRTIAELNRSIDALTEQVEHMNETCACNQEDTTE